MKIETPIKRYAFIVLLMSLFLVTLFTAVLIYQYYGVVARGILGLVMLYLLYFFGRYSNIDVTLDSLLLASNKGKYVIAAFLGGIMASWSTIQVIEMLSFFMKR